MTQTTHNIYIKPKSTPPKPCECGHPVDVHHIATSGGFGLSYWVKCSATKVGKGWTAPCPCNKPQSREPITALRCPKCEEFIVLDDSPLSAWSTDAELDARIEEIAATCDNPNRFTYDIKKLEERVAKLETAPVVAETDLVKPERLTQNTQPPKKRWWKL